MVIVGLNGHYLKTDRTWVSMVQTQTTNILSEKKKKNLKPVYRVILLIVLIGPS